MGSRLHHVGYHVIRMCKLLHHTMQLKKIAMASSNSVLVFLLSLSCVLFLPCKGQGKRVTCPISRLGYLCLLYNAEQWSHRYIARGKGVLSPINACSYGGRWELLLWRNNNSNGVCVGASHASTPDYPLSSY